MARDSNLSGWERVRQSTFLWGCGSMVAAIVLMVVGTMTHDTRPWLIVAWPFAIFAVWEFARTISKDSRVVCWCSAIGTVLTGCFLLWLYLFLTPTSSLVAKTAESHIFPDITLTFTGKTSPLLTIENNSDVVAETIKWSPLIWNIDDPRTYINPEPPPNTHDPLPIPTQTFDFLRPHAKSLPIALFDGLRAFVKPGQRLFGSVSVVCPKCKRGRTYILSVIYGEGGWYWLYNQAVEGERIMPKTGHKEDILPWLQSIEQFIPLQERINIP
jgi:hypothetical protein